MTGFVLQILYINGVGAAPILESQMSTEDRKNYFENQFGNTKKLGGEQTSIALDSDEAERTRTLAHMAPGFNKSKDLIPFLRQSSTAATTKDHETGVFKRTPSFKRSAAEREQLEQNKKQKSDNFDPWRSSNQPGASGVVGARTDDSGANGSGFMSSKSNYYGYGANYGQGTGSIYRHDM